ncbi:MAG: hypothetical protein ACRDN6_11555, partial [Gaiellaceae bacterium]
AAIPAVEAFNADNATYSGMTLVSLQAYDAGVKNILLDAAQLTATSYCVYSTVGSKYTYFKNGPAGDIVEDTTPLTTPCA